MIVGCASRVHVALQKMQGAEAARRGTPPPGILQKSPQAIENKGNECQKERQEKPRARKPLKTI